MDTRTKGKTTENEDMAHLNKGQSTDVAPLQQGGTDVELYDPGEDAGAGMEDMRIEERRIPFLRILDPKSPQCKPASHGGIPGARGGSLYNTSTNQVFDGEKGLTIIPCAREYGFVEYIRREEDGSGGGFVAVHEPDEPLVKQLRAEQGKFKKLQMPGLDENGKVHELVETYSLYCIVLAPNGDQFRAILGFSSTQCKKATGLYDRIDNFRYQGKRKDGTIGPVKPAMWAHRWHVKTIYENKGSNSWYGWVITLAEKEADGTEKSKEASRLSLKDPLYADGKEFNALVAQGAVRADFAKAEDNFPDRDEIPNS